MHVDGPDSTPETEYSALWARPGLVMAGVGRATVLDPGTGPERYRRALDLLRAAKQQVAFASFTFDPEEEGSVVVVPESISSDFHVEADSHRPGSIDEDDAERWPKMVAEALVEIDRDSVEKVVLSRRIRACFNQPLDPFAVAHQLLRTQPGCNVYAIEGLVGASPELLLRIRDGRIHSTPLAGSATKGAPGLSSDKNVYEHELAAESVDQAFRKAGVEYERSDPETVVVGDLRHLGTRFEGSAPPGFGFADILPHLHPTAAVAGTPTDIALEIIREMEETSRGRYSGPVGWFADSGEGEFAVALRCGQIEGKTAVLHSGAGIVAGSKPDEELEETEWKLQPMLNALGLSDA